MSNSNDQETLIKIGKQITRLRESQKLTKVQLAFELGIDEKHLRRIEKGELNFGVSLLKKIAVALDSSIDDLVFGVEN